MPFSHSAQISTIVGFAERLQPQSVLDVGVGMGQYGFLLRTNLEGEHLFEIAGCHARQRPRSEWRTRIDGIEGYRGYLTPVHEWAYNQVIVGEALATLRGLGESSYDLVLAVDILEHFDVEDGGAFLAECRRIARRAALISTPKDFHEQHVAANPLEDHRSVWSATALQAAGFGKVLPDSISWIALYER